MKINYFILSVLIFLISACSSAVSYESGQCLPSETSFSYPIGDVVDLPSPQKPELVFPSAPWKKVGSITFPLENKQVFSVSSFVVTTVDGNRVLLAVSPSISGILSFDLQTKKTVIFDRNNEFLSKSILFEDKKGTLWAAKTIGNSDSLLQILDQPTGKFINAKDKNGLIDSGGENSTVIKIKADSVGKIWLMVYKPTVEEGDYHLYSYDPIMAAAKEYFFDRAIDGTFEIGQNDLVYLLSSDTQTVITLNPQNGTPSTYKVLTPITPAQLYYDSSNRLWIGNMGWFDFSDQSAFVHWYKIIQAPDFVTYITSAGIWVSVSPIYTAETQDGRLWYYASNGTGWVDPQMGKWCYFSNIPSMVYQDSSGDLWTVMDNFVYKLERIK